LAAAVSAFGGKAAATGTGRAAANDPERNILGVAPNVRWRMSMYLDR
jgi:hypothetical protein